jgi:hypothetical protein
MSRNIGKELPFRAMQNPKKSRISITSGRKPEIDHFNIILQRKSRFSKESLFYGFSHQNSACISFGRHTCYITSPSIVSWYCEMNNIYWGSQLIKNLVMQFASEFSLFIFPCKHLHFSQSYILHHQPFIFLQYEKPNWTRTQSNKQKCIFL